MVVRFTVKGTYPTSMVSFPIYDETGPLAGAGTVDNGNIKCFVAHNSFPSALEITSGQPFYFKPIYNNGEIDCAIISTTKFPDSEKVIL